MTFPFVSPLKAEEGVPLGLLSLQLDLGSPFASEFHSPEENCKFQAFPATRVTGEDSPTDPSLYPLIEKMFFILNTLNSSMTQLHSKVDLLSLEVVRIKKQIKPGEMVTEFQPPPEYLLTSEELSQLMEQTSGAGELGCRLLVHLFPELFKARDVPKEYLLSREQLKSNYDCSLSIGNFASRILVLMFPELFTQENTRKHYNCSGSLGKKQLDPVRVNLIRHYVQLLYPQAKNDRVWMFEFVGKLDERCRRRDTEQRRSYQQQRKVYGHEREHEAGDAVCQVNQFNVDDLREDTDIPTAPPEKSSKDFCKIPLDELSVTLPDFPVPSVYLLSDTEVREIVQQSLSVGNFAARLLVRLFPELFTQENLRLQYNHSGACNKKQLDPGRLRLIRHYVEAVYPVEKMEEVWHYECVPSIDERCRRPNRKKCDILKKAKRSSTVS
ncbi:hypothetical protein CRUP_036477 [Coryphaenoides rupestris]|nr:hypothetical protein CRUP_036477 [Coryphaenoides rupestris]